MSEFVSAQFVSALKKEFEEKIKISPADMREKTFLDYVKANGLFLACSDLVDKSDLSNYALFLLTRKTHEYRYYAVKKELIALAEKLKDIQYVFLKGITNAERYYDDPLVREFCDIDILVNLEDIREISAVFHEMDYVFEDDKQLSEVLGLYYSSIYISPCHHLLPMKKFLKNGLILNVELHVALSANWCKDNCSLTPYILNHSICYTLENTKTTINVMDSYNNICYLAYSFCHDFEFEVFVRWMYHMIDEVIQNMKLIMDIFHILKKEKVDYNKLIFRAKNLGFLKETMFVLKLIADLFQIATCNYFLKDWFRSNIAQPYFCSALINHCSSLDFLFDRITPLFKAGIYQILKNNADISNIHEINYFNQTGYIIEGEMPKNEMDCSVRNLVIHHNAEYINFEFSILDDIVVYAEADCWSDSIDLRIYNADFVNFHDSLFFFRVELSNKDNMGDAVLKKIDIVNYLYDIKDISSSLYACEFIRQEKGYAINLAIKWELFNIDVETVSLLGIDIYINDIDKIGKELHTKLSLTPQREFLFNPSFYLKYRLS